MFLLLLAGLICLIWVTTLLRHAIGLRKLPDLPMREEAAGTEPLVSIIVAAKEEENSITNTLQGLLQQNYSNFELIVVNDRSEDRTGERIAEARAWAEENGLGEIPFEIVTIEHLPADWLGKNHALYQGYRHAKGDILLFTDADIRFARNTLRSSVAYLREQQADHLTIAPAMTVRGFWLKSFVQYFLFVLSIAQPLWLANDDSRREGGFGIGAFNMMSREGYEKIGTHRTIALRPDDDVMLGQEVKRQGLRQRMVLGMKALQVEWYPSLREAVRGLEKNMFAGMKYSLLLYAFAVLLQLLTSFIPYVLVFVTTGWTQGLMAAGILSAMTLYLIYGRRVNGYNGVEVLLLPFTCLIFLYILTRSTWLTLKQGGIFWRGTFYSLSELKKMHR